VNRLLWFWVGFSLTLTWVLDRVTKNWALGLTKSINYGNLEFSLHYNPGAILGLFSELPPVLRVVTLSTGGAFLIFSFIMLQYFIPIKAMSIRVGMSLLLGGILGNVADRVTMGHVVDFIIVKFGDWSSPVFNVADAIQWFGHISVIWGLLKHADTFWPEQNTRKSYWVNIKFQLKYCMLLIAVGLGIGVISGTFAYTYLRVTIISLTGENNMILNKFLIPFTISFASISGVFIMILFLVGKMISHRVAGPVYRFEKYIIDLISGKYYSLKLRRADEFQHLNGLGEKLKDHIQKSNPVPAIVLSEEEALAASEALATIDSPPLLDSEIALSTGPKDEAS
jgi:signal peptidase II